jgi:hypothetical protein
LELKKKNKGKKTDESISFFSLLGRTTLRTYIETMMEPVSLNVTGEQSFYHFGSHNFQQFNTLFENYRRPPFPEAMPPLGSVSWGLGGHGSGLPFHVHGMCREGRKKEKKERKNWCRKFEVEK